MHGRDHVDLSNSLASFRRKLPGVRRILRKLVDDHVKPVFEPFKHRRDHVKLKRDHVELRLKLHCSNVIASLTHGARRFLIVLQMNVVDACFAGLDTTHYLLEVRVFDLQSIKDQ